METRLADDDEEVDTSRLPPSEPDPVGHEALGQAVLLFDSWGLSFPPVPERLAPAVRVLDTGLLGTRSDAPGPYGIDWFLRELGSGSPAADYLILGHAGHGTNSWAMHYYLVLGPLAVFVQVSWGGAYTDREGADAEVRRAFAQLERLVRAPSLDRLAAGERYVVVQSDLTGGGVTLWPGEGPLRLEQVPEPLAAAVASMGG